MFNTVLVRPFFNLLMLIYGVVPGHDFGLAIIIMTVLVRLLLWPILAQQLRSQKKMQNLAPDVARVKKAAKGDRQLESKMLMELYKEKEINPFASFVPLIIQFPLFIALYLALRDVIKPGEVAHLIYHSLNNVAAIKTIIAHPADFKPSLFGLINLSKASPILALIAGGTQYFQTKQLLPKKVEKGDSQAQALASTSKIFPILTFIIGLKLPSALALYWAVSSGVAILQQSVELKEDAGDIEKMIDAPEPKQIAAKPDSKKPQPKKQKSGKRKK